MIRSRVFSALIACTGLVAFSPAFAKTCNVEIEGNDMMQYNKPSIAIAADCTEVAVTLKHSGKLPLATMGHNWVLTETPVFQQVATAGLAAGLAADYLPKNDARIIAHTKMIGGGETTSVTFPTSKLKKGGAYTYFCTFPGHWGIMKGTLTFG
ncbi:MAG: azurin [Steroidobacteraceae bacterium]